MTSDEHDPDFAPEPLIAIDRQALYHGARSLTRKVFRDVASMGLGSAHLQEVLAREDEIIARLRRFSAITAPAKRIRCHGDYHLGQVLWTGKDFVIIDFDGEPFRSLAQRRLKRPAVYDLAGMVRSLHYAGQAAELRLTRELGIAVDGTEFERIETWVTFWHRWVAGTFLEAYLALASKAGYLPPSASRSPRCSTSSSWTRPSTSSATKPACDRAGWTSPLAGFSTYSPPGHDPSELRLEGAGRALWDPELVSRSGRLDPPRRRGGGRRPPGSARLGHREAR